MINSTSIKTRFLISVAANMTRTVIGFFSGLLVARSLNPSGYGDMTFLLGSFVAVRSLLDMGSSSAFYTFISQRPRGNRFYRYYFIWLAIQFVIPALLVAVLMPREMMTRIWLGQSRMMVLIAFAAAFTQQQLWQTVTQIGESSRKTVLIQVINIAVAISHLLLVLGLLAFGFVTVTTMFWLLIAENLAASVVALWFLRKMRVIAGANGPEDASPRSLFKDYYIYCKPLALLSVVAFFYEFADRWLLQRFGGSTQQGFYQIAYQFSTVSLLATTSILNVFWKEIAEASERQDKERLAALYHKISRSLVILGAILSGFLIPWSGQLVLLILGESYIMAVPALAIMFLYPIHQSLGQIGGTMVLAQGRTGAYMTLAIIMKLISMPISYLVQAPAHGTPIPGLGLGAVGLALKMVGMNIISVNILAWIIAQYHDWKFDWLYQVVGISLAVGAGYLAKTGAGFFWDLSASEALRLLPPFLASGVLYLILMTMVILTMPWLIGMDRGDIQNLFARKRAA